MIRFSVIMACKNAASTIESALDSLDVQDHPAAQTIVVDGQSSDRTLEILARRRRRITTLVSEKDGGVYDALNKGLSRAAGDVVAFLHADDFYPHTRVLSHVARAFEGSGADAVYGDLEYVRRGDSHRVVRRWKAGAYAPGDFLNGWMPPHPAFFLKREFYQRYGGFNTALSISADYELMLRMLHKHGLRAHYLPEVLARMRAGGLSNRSLLARLRANLEDRRAWRLNDLRPNLLTLWKKPLRKLGQYA